MLSKKRAAPSRKTGPASYKRSKVDQPTVKRVSNVAEVKRIQNLEVRPGTAATYYLREFAKINQGSGETERDGRAVKLLFSELNLHVDSAEAVRVIVFKWKNGLSDPAIADVLQDYSTAYGVAGYNINYAGTYEVLLDKWCNGINATSHAYRWVIKHPCVQTYFSTGADDVANTTFWVAVISPDNAAIEPYQYGVSTSFTDL